MSTVRRLFDDPRNTEVANGRAIQKCCDGNAPYWDTYRIRDWEDAWDDSDRNMTAYKQSDPLQVQDDTGASDNNVNVPEYDINGKFTGSNDLYKGMVLVEGPNSGYRPDFVSPTEWMAWQGVEWSADPRGVKMANGQYTTSLPNPPRWRRTRIRTDKMRWGKGIRGWGAYGHTFLWCQKCETALESAWSDTLDALPMIARGVAMVVSNIPVFGTAISFVINAAVSLAQGAPLDDAMLDAVGGALPGQPTSGMAFRMGVSIAKGNRIDQVAIDALPIPPEMKRLVKVAANVVYGIASGQNVTNVVYNEIRNQLPPNAQQAMDVARRVARGENVANVILTEAERAVVQRVQAEAARVVDYARTQGEAAIASARAQGEAALAAARKQAEGALAGARAQAESLVNQYASETGYQIAMMALETWQRDAISTGLACGAMMGAEKSVPMFASVPEKPTAKSANDGYLAKGQAIVAAGARYKGVKLSDLLAGKAFSVEVAQPDLLNGGWRNVLQKYSGAAGARAAGEFQVDDAFRRGFLIATGVCEGMSERGPGQTAVYQTLAEKGGRAGFDAGQAIAHYRTLKGDGLISMQDLVTQEVQPNAAFAILAAASPGLKTTASAVSTLASVFTPPPPSTLKPAMGLPTLKVTPLPTVSFFVPPPVAPEVIAQKATDRAHWVDYYKKLG